MQSIEDMAKNLAEDSGASYMEWLDALSEGNSLKEEAHLDDRSFAVLADASASPRQFSLMVEAMDEYCKEHPGEGSGFILLANYADESPYCLGDWIAALEYIYDWLAAAKRVSPGLKPLLEYISCCVEAASSTPVGYPLQATVEEMLERYGIETE